MQVVSQFLTALFIAISRQVTLQQDFLAMETRAITMAAVVVEDGGYSRSVKLLVPMMVSEQEVPPLFRSQKESYFLYFLVGESFGNY